MILKLVLEDVFQVYSRFFFQSNKLNDYALIMRIIICPNQTLYAELLFEGQNAMFKCPIFLIDKVTVLAFGNETTKCMLHFR